ncbi:MAG: lipocalin family protein, partial [Pseudomonadota bacterium]
MRAFKGLLLVGALALAACSGPVYRDVSVPMTTHGPVDLERYQGLWYEIARYPNSFEEGCFGVTAEYSLNPDGSIKVVNTCRQGALNGPTEVADGRATLTSPEGDKLKVGFVPWLPFAVGD